MTSIPDSLAEARAPDRVHYELGVLLGAEDFKAEQDYHRGRLAAALRRLFGAGTAAGLRVTHAPATAGDAETPATEEEIMVAPGLALDALGRIIEFRRAQCVRLARWLDGQPTERLRQGWHAAGVAWDGAPAGIVLDLFVAFLACERGKTPSFAAGPFDSLDAVTAARVRDGVETTLVVRTEAAPPLPSPEWPDFTASAAPAEAFGEAVLDAWDRPDDSTDLLLARIVVGADAPVGDAAPVRIAAGTVTINNHVRRFVFPAHALARGARLGP